MGSLRFLSLGLLDSTDCDDVDDAEQLRCFSRNILLFILLVYENEKDDLVDAS